MKTFLASSEEDSRLWEQFVHRHPDCHNYHRWGWKKVIERSFSWPTFYLMAGEGGQIEGILPLVWQKSRLFGSFLTSLPFVNAGGIVGESPEASQSLLHGAIALARRLGVKYMELRHRVKLGLGLPAKTTKVAPVRPVESDAEKMWQALHHKVRTDIRKAMGFDLGASFGGEEHLDDFYQVFAENMRDLGTPVYARKFFLEILRTFPNDTYICVVRHQSTTVAASFLTGYRNTLEAVWSASSYRHLSMKPSMFLYWKILCFAGEQGYRVFDFGRSTVASGTHRFKQQWGTEDVPLHWDYWLKDGRHLPELNPENPRYGLAVWLWRRLPLPVTKLVGPRIVRCLP